MANILHVERAANKITLGTTGTTINVASHTASLSLGLDASKNLESVDLSAIYQPLDAVLTDLAALSVVADNEFIVGTGAGTYAHENPATAATSMGLGTGDSVTFAGLTLTNATAIEFTGGTRKWISRLATDYLSFVPRNDGDDNWDWNRQLKLDGSTGFVAIGNVIPKTKLTIVGTLTLKEQATADADTISYGQIWVKNDDPNTLWFTDDDGTDYAISPKILTVTASAGNTNVSGVSTVLINSSGVGNNIDITGFASGVIGQVIYVTIIDHTNTVSMKHNDGGGTQKLMMHDSSDEALTDLGGWIFTFDGTYWYDISHAKHV